MSQLLHLPDLAAPRTRMGSALAAGARVKQGEAGTARGRVLRVADPVRRECLVPVPPPPVLAAGRRGDDDDVDEERQRYYLNLGYAIRTLREELPDVLCKDHSFDIYRFHSNSIAWPFLLLGWRTRLSCWGITGHGCLLALAHILG
jgi:hypothetical protein|uniref:Uncharacterized protein n=1 Tax=Zea mays TaxID=4577 RepID=B4FNI6_MAIZE|nr:unknown [Zea mays]